MARIFLEMFILCLLAVTMYHVIVPWFRRGKKVVDSANTEIDSKIEETATPKRAPRARKPKSPKTDE